VLAGKLALEVWWCYTDLCVFCLMDIFFWPGSFRSNHIYYPVFTRHRKAAAQVEANLFQHPPNFQVSDAFAKYARPLPNSRPGDLGLERPCAWAT